PRNPHENSSSIAANYHMSFPCKGFFSTVIHISGLVCISIRQDVFMWKICNPSTRQCFTLSQVKTNKQSSWVRTFFGYDPIEKQVKVLSMTLERVGNNVISDNHQVLTLENDKMSWRRIKCVTPHTPSS